MIETEPTGRMGIPFTPVLVTKATVSVLPVGNPLSVPLFGTKKGAEIGATLLRGGGEPPTVIVTVMVIDSVTVTAAGQFVGLIGPGPPGEVLSSGIAIVPVSPGPPESTLVREARGTPPMLAPSIGPPGFTSVDNPPEGGKLAFSVAALATSETGGMSGKSVI